MSFLDIPGISSFSEVSQNAKYAEEDSSLGKEDFLNLLLTQLRHQDPLNPLDSTEFTAQLTQFTSIEELSNINSTLDDVLAFQKSMQNATVTNMIGNNVTVSGNTVYLNGTAEMSYELSDDPAAVHISVYDGTGRLVRSEELGPQAAGLNTYVWDGIDSQGNQLPAGNYTFEVEAQDDDGNRVETVTNSSGLVTGVIFEDNMTYLELDGGRKIYLSDIRSINQS